MDPQLRDEHGAPRGADVLRQMLTPINTNDVAAEARLAAHSRKESSPPAQPAFQALVLLQRDQLGEMQIFVPDGAEGIKEYNVGARVIDSDMLDCPWDNILFDGFGMAMRRPGGCVEQELKSHLVQSCCCVDYAIQQYAAQQGRATLDQTGLEKRGPFSAMADYSDRADPAGWIRVRALEIPLRSTFKWAELEQVRATAPPADTSALWRDASDPSPPP